MACDIIIKKEKIDQQVGGDLKIIVIGDRKCGKTEFIQTFASRTEEEVESCSALKFATEYSAQYTINSVLWNIKIIEILGVPKRLVNLVTTNHSDTNGIIFMYAIDDPSGFEEMHEKWIQTLVYNGFKTNQPTILIGNKMDLRENRLVIERLAYDKKAPVSSREGKDLQRERGLDKFFEISSLDKDESVKKAVRFIVKNAYKHFRQGK